MDNAEQTTRTPPKGIFDTASLLGIPNTQKPVCKTSGLSNLVGVSSKKLSKAKTSEKETNHGKNSEKLKAAANNLPSPLSSASTTSGNSLIKSSRKTADTFGDQSQTLPSVEKSSNKRKTKPKVSKADNAKSEKRNKSEKKQVRQSKEKKAKKSSSESESHMDSSCSSTGGDTSGAVSSTSSESSDEEEREKQKELARLKKQQQELRRKVQELKQASHENGHQKMDLHPKKTSVNSKTMHPLGNSLNHSLKPVPSPAHSFPAMATAPTDLSPKTQSSFGMVIEDEQNSSFPLDLCVKKQEPTFEVTSSLLANSCSPSIVSTTTAKKKQQSSGSNLCSNNKSNPPKKRGRKPKPATVSDNSSQPDKVCNAKQHSMKDITSLTVSSKMLDTVSSHSVNSSVKTTNSVITSKAHLSGSSIAISSSPKKNFTLDSLLGESNGVIDSCPQFHESESVAFSNASFSSKSSRTKERQRYSNRIKKSEEKVKEPEPPSQPESSSASDSDPDDENSDSEETDQSPAESVADGASNSDRKHKRGYEDDGDDFPNKKRRAVPDEREIQIPLEHGWRRETRIRCFSRSGVRGEVTYYAPCGKKLRSYPEVVRYLLKNGIIDISRDNFTFSTKVNMGEFLENSGSSQEYVQLTAEEVVARIEEARTRKGRLGVQNRKSSQQKSTEEEEQQREWEQKQLQQHLEQQEHTRHAQESKSLRQAQREQALMAAREERRLKAEENRKQKEQQRLIKQQEKFERLEQLRIEREIRAQQMLEEMQKRREMLLMVDLERERRRQHMILVRALENRKKQEERERKREEILFEKRINREKKMEQRRMELDYLRELKKPVDDMMLKDLMPLPDLNRIPGVKLSGKAFADTLMVFEFLHNFGETLGFDMESLPSLNTMQMALLNLDEKCEEELLSVVHHLLVCVIEDPGVPHSSESATILGQSLKDADITNNNISEILRLFFIAQDKRSHLLEWLQTKPFLSLNPTQKAEIIAYLCDELLTSRLLTRQIDSNIENVNVLRKDKWLVEGDLRRLRSIQQRRALKAKLCAMEENRDNNFAGILPTDISELNANNLPKDNQVNLEDAGKDKDKLDDIESELANESGNESDDTQAPGQLSDAEDEDLHLSNDEINKRIEKLSKQLTQCSNRLTKAFYTIRGATFGMDRYHRRYWVLPKSGGVFVESMESSLKVEEREKVLNASQQAECKNEESDAREVICLDDKDNTTQIKENVTSKDEATPSDKINENTEAKDDKADTVLKQEVFKNLKLKDESSSENKECPVEEKENNNEEKISIKEEVIDLNTKSKIPYEEISEDGDITLEKPENEKLLNTCESKIQCFPPIKEECEIKICSSVKEIDGVKVSPGKNDVDAKEPSPMVKDNEFNIFTENKIGDLKPFSAKKDFDIKHICPEKSTDEKKICFDNKDNLSDILRHSFKKESDSKSKKDDKRDKNKEYENKIFDRLEDVKDEKKSNVNIFMPNLCDNMNLDLGTPKMHNGSERHQSSNPSIPPEQNWFLHSPFFASILAGNMLFNGPLMSQRDVNGTYFNLPKNDSNNPFGPFLGLQPGMLSAEQIFKSLGEKPSNQKPWFSILPRMPCDESLINNSQAAKNSHSSPTNICTQDARSGSRMPHALQVPGTSPSGHVASALSNLQMELLNGVPPGFFLHPFLPPQFGPTYQSSPPITCSSHQTSYTSTMPHVSAVPDFNFNFNRPPSSSTPNSIPTPSATPGIGSHGCNTPTSRDSPSPCFAKRLIMEKMTQEYEKPQPIPVELQRGWWRITDPNQLKLVISALHHRGIREKMFQKQLQKHFTFACTSCSQGQNDDTKLEVTDLDEKMAKLVGGASDPDDPDSWSRDVALRVDLAILEQVENLEEKVDGSSMQVKCWKPPPKLSTESVTKFVPSTEQYIQRKVDDIMDSIRGKNPRKGGKKAARKKKLAKKEQDSDPSENDSEKKTEDEKGDVAESVETAEPNSEDGEKNISEDANKSENDLIPLPPGKMNPVEEAKKRLLKVEAAIERRYLRPPLGASSFSDLNKCTLSNSGTNNNQSSSENSEEDHIPVGLVKWRNAVQNCRTSAQLAMCLNFLETCTAWDKSIMRASCQFCHSGDNEEKLLLCDGCDKGYHTYCFKPVMETIPDGDWYCYECLNKATGENVCVICGTKGKLIECELCPKTFHLSCLDPPLGKMPKAKWYCSGCSLTRPKKSYKKSNTNKEKENTKETKETPEKPTKKEKKKQENVEKKEKKEKAHSSTQGNKDLSPCSAILDEVEKHEDAWPFLTPVNTKQFPTYRKIIKKPMDIATMRNKLESGQYKCREEFAMDARLIFDNCETFNEDDSPVGQAGHSMRAFFETRWSEHCIT